MATKYVHDSPFVVMMGSDHRCQAEPAQYEAGPEGYKKIRNTGSPPHFNDWCTIVVDDIGKKIYMYGGSRPNDDNYIPTNDFHVLDVDTMQWKKLSVWISHNYWFIHFLNPSCSQNSGLMLIGPSNQ